MSDTELRRKAEEWCNKHVFDMPTKGASWSRADFGVMAYLAGFKEANRWVPCSERLPEPTEKVLVLDISNNWGEAWFTGEEGAYYWDADTFGYRKGEVKAWRPVNLPEDLK